MQVRFYANLRDLLKASVVDLDLCEATSMRDVLDRLAARYPKLHEKLWDAEGKQTNYVQILLNGRPIQYLQGLDTPVQPTDNLRLFPPVGGG